MFLLQFHSWKFVGCRPLLHFLHCISASSCSIEMQVVRWFELHQLKLQREASMVFHYQSFGEGKKKMIEKVKQKVE